MKRSLLVFMLLACSSTPLIGENNELIQLVARSCKRKNDHCRTCAPTPISRPGTIRRSGVYCLTRDIVGTITIAASNVILDLNSHLINGNGAPAAITTTGFNDIIIKNGAVTNPGSLGISSVNSTGFIVENVQVYGSDRALALIGNKNSQVKIFKAYNNTNTFVSPAGVGSAVILVDTSANIEFFDVQANNNVKALTAVPAGGTTDPGLGIITVDNSENVTFTEVTTNNNTRTNNNSRFAPLFAIRSKSVKFINSQSNNNSITVADTRGFAAIHFRLSLDTVTDGCQANGNRIPVSTTSFLRGIYLVDTSRNVVTNSQADDNFIQLFASPVLGDLVGIFLFGSNNGQSDNIVSSCQASGNRVADGGSNRTGFGLVVGLFINGFSDETNNSIGFENRTTVEYSQFNNNIIQSNGALQSAQGIVVENISDVTIDHCACDGNRGGSSAFGILVLGSIIDDTIFSIIRNVKIMNCTANDSSATDFAAGIFVAGSSSGNLQSVAEACEVIDSQSHRNISTNVIGAGHGIALQNARSCSIIGCQMENNSGSGLYAGGTSLFQIGDLNQINQNNAIINCSATDNIFIGFDFSNVGTNNNFLIQDNFALRNGAFGFRHTPAVLNSAFISNYAADNTLFNFDVAPNTIQLFTLNRSTGVYTYVSGTNTLTKLTNIAAPNP